MHGLEAAPTVELVGVTADVRAMRREPHTVGAASYPIERQVVAFESGVVTFEGAAGQTLPLPPVLRAPLPEGRLTLPEGYWAN